MKRVVQTGGLPAGSSYSSSGLSIWVFVILMLLMDEDHLFSDLPHVPGKALHSAAYIYM